jgi:hypothetical protein
MPYFTCLYHVAGLLEIRPEMDTRLPFDTKHGVQKSALIILTLLGLHILCYFDTLI